MRYRLLAGRKDAFASRTPHLNAYSLATVFTASTRTQYGPGSNVRTAASCPAYAIDLASTLPSASSRYSSASPSRSFNPKRTAHLTQREAVVVDVVPIPSHRLRQLLQPTLEPHCRDVSQVVRARMCRTRLVLLPSVRLCDAVPTARQRRPWLHIAAYTPGARATCRRSPLPLTACRCLPSIHRRWPPRSRYRQPPA